MSYFIRMGLAPRSGEGRPDIIMPRLRSLKLRDGRPTLQAGHQQTSGSAVSVFSGWNNLLNTAVAAALTSLDDTSVIPERKRLTPVRSETFAWLDKNRYSFVPSVELFHVGRKRAAKYRSHGR